MMLNNGLRFDFVFPTFNVWKNNFATTLVPINDVDMEDYYNLIYGKYQTRYLKWSNETQAYGNMVPLIVDTFFKFKQYKVMYSKLYNELATNSIDDYAYGLPGMEDEITDANQGKYLLGKGRKKQNPSNLGTIEELNKLQNLMNTTIEQVAKWFLPFVWTEGSYTII